jgi:hypothetical protein
VLSSGRIILEWLDGFSPKNSHLELNVIDLSYQHTDLTSEEYLEMKNHFIEDIKLHIPSDIPLAYSEVLDFLVKVN